MQRRGGIAAGKLERNKAHFFMDEAIRGENDWPAELIRRAVKIGDFSTGFFDEDNAGSSVPTFQTEFPEAVEAACGDAGKIECGGTVAADSMGTQCEIVIVMNVGARLALVNGKAGTEKACGQSRNFGDGDFVAVECRAFAAGCGIEFFVNGIVDDAGKDLIAMRKSNGNTEARVTVGEVGCAIEGVDVPAKIGVVIFAEAFFGGDGVGREIL